MSYQEQDYTISFSKILIEELIFFIPVFILVYSNFFVKQHFFDKRKYGQYVLFLFGLTVVGTYMFYLTGDWSGSSGNSILNIILNVVSILILSTGLQYFKRGIVSQFQMQELKAKKLESELNALKAQVNPHFLFNTLNNIYGLNQINPQKGSEMILGLSDVMRYNLNQSNNDFVKIEDEIQLLNSYVDLEKLRLNKNFDLKLDLSGVNPNLEIYPLLLLPFVENAFKHGTHPIKPCFIHFCIKSENRRFFFEIINSKINSQNKTNTKIGLDNAKRRLEIVYPNKHHLTFNENDEQFQVSLMIEL